MFNLIIDLSHVIFIAGEVKSAKSKEKSLTLTTHAKENKIERKGKFSVQNSFRMTLFI